MQEAVTRNDDETQENKINRDKINDEWRPAPVVAEPGTTPEIYHTGFKLGQGGFTVCFEETLQRTGQAFAMKVVESQIEQKGQLDKIQSIGKASSTTVQLS